MKSGIAPKTLVLCDFDGTLCSLDMGNTLLNRFTGDGWQEIDRAYCTGDIGSREAYERVAGLIRADEKELLDFVHAYGRIDDYFPEFYAACRREGMDVMVVSDGLDFYIEAILKRFHLADLIYFSNAVRFREKGRLEISFPEWNAECNRCGTCKRNIVRRNREKYDQIIYVGNGHSDVCPSKEADVVFAKEILYEKCREDGTPCIFYESFKDVRNHLFCLKPLPTLKGGDCER
jgi:2-hydroxy-3-keto-5-methylthiopentenyl-1-phosphate phosphatase